MSRKGDDMAVQEQEAGLLARNDMTEVMGGQGWEIPAEVVSDPEVSLEPGIYPDSPMYHVPANPLLPADYNEVLDYNAIQYLNGIFRTQIGRYVRVSQLVGSNTVEEFEGYLIGMGINYIILQDYITGNIRILDVYGIKSMYVYYKNIRSLLSED